MNVTEPVKLRILTLRDLDIVTDLDKSLFGLKRRGYWEARLERIEISGAPSLAAELDGKVVGFILGSTSVWEHGIPENVAWIDTIGVRKEYREKGIARLLLKEMASIFKKMGIDTIYILASWKDKSLLQFCDKMGFKKGEMINLEMKI